MASGSAGEGAGSNTDKRTSKVVIVTAPVFATSLEPPGMTEGERGFESFLLFFVSVCVVFVCVEK